MDDCRPALDVRTPARRPDLIPLLDALLDDFHPFAVEPLDAVRRRIHCFSAVVIETMLGWSSAASRRGSRSSSVKLMFCRWGTLSATSLSIQVSRAR